ncbi:hypothetical protein PQX77_006075, partial [Marasmius sp. AFHP31]
MSRQPSNATPQVPANISVIFFSVSSEVDLDTSRIPRTIEISSTMTFKKFLSEGIRLQRDDAIFPSDIDIDLEDARIFVTASPRQQRQVLQEIGSLTVNFKEILKNLTLVLENHAEDTLVLDFFRKHAPWLLSNPKSPCPILVRQKNNVPFDLVLDIYKTYYRALRITRARTKDFCTKDRELNKLVEADEVPGLNLRLWEVIKEVKEKKIKLNKAQFNRATDNARYMLNCPFFWDRIKSTGCFEIVGDGTDNKEMEDDGCNEILLWTLVFNTGRVFRRADEFTFKKQTSTGIKGSMVQNAICDIYEGKDYE